MATLIHPKVATRPVASPLLNSSVPAPFPRELLQQQQLKEFTGQQVQTKSEPQATGPSLVSDADNVRSSTIHGVLVSKYVNCSK
jgi:hypothetical protein